MKLPKFALGIHSSWLTRFWAVVRYEMLWTIRKKKFIGIIVIAFALATLSLALPVLLSSTTETEITENANFAITFGVGGFGFFLFALAIAMNSISSEFESGTIVPLLTKPVSRTMVFLGKLFSSFIIILISYVILFTYTTVGSIFVYGPQNHLELIPLVMLGNLISTFVWISILLAMGSLTKNTILTALIGLGLFLALFIALPVVSVFLGPSASLNYFPGTGATGTLALDNNSTLSVSAGIDNIGTNLVYGLLYPSANVTFGRIDLQATQENPSALPIMEILYTEPMSIVALRALGIGLAYTGIFLFIAWLALKKSQILE